MITENELHDYNTWLMEVWNPNQLRIPFAQDASRAYLKYKNEQSKVSDKPLKNPVMNKFYISNTLNGSFVCPLLIETGGQYWGVSNYQKSNSNYTLYVNLNEPKVNYRVYDHDYSLVNPVYDDAKFKSKYPHFSSNCKRLADKYNAEYELVKDLVDYGFTGYDKPFPYSEEIIKIISDKWKCNWHNCEGDIRVSISFHVYYYVLELKRIDNSLVVTQKRYCKKLLEESIDLFNK